MLSSFLYWSSQQWRKRHRHELLHIPIVIPPLFRIVQLQYIGRCNAAPRIVRRQLAVIAFKDTFQHSQIRFILRTIERFVAHQPVLARGRLLKACLVERVDPGERERFRFLRIRKFQLIRVKTQTV